MRSKAWLIAALLLGVLSTGCNDAGGGMSAAPSSGKPEDAEDIWTIRCIDVPGPTRQQLSKNYADALRKVKGLKPELVQVIDQEQASIVYYGRYRRVPDTRGDNEVFKPDQRSDLDLIRKLSFVTSDGQTVWPFYLATIDTLSIGSHVPPEWNLTRAKGYWSLQVGVFYDQNQMRQRRYAAEEYCKLLRSQGEEAYFHHGAERSAVFIGAYPKDALQNVRKSNALTGVPEFSMKIVDPQMTAAQQRNPYNIENGAIAYDIETDAKTGEKHRLPRNSFPVEIPRSAQNDVPPRTTTPRGSQPHKQ